jgi:transcriptional regulator with XRE-family HTH domain
LSPTPEALPPTTHKSQLATRLRQLRAEHGLSLSQLARATGISSSFLSLIEQAQSDITIGRLVRLAEFYDVELGDLLSGPPTAPADHVRILRAAPDHMLHSPTEGVDVYDLTCGARWTLVPALSSFRPAGSIEIDDEHEHERMLYILEGTFELVFPGEAPTRLRVGEGVTFHSVGQYRLTNVGRGQGRVLAVRVHPEPGRTVDSPARD